MNHGRYGAGSRLGLLSLATVASLIAVSCSSGATTTPTPTFASTPTATEPAASPSPSAQPSASAALDPPSPVLTAGAAEPTFFRQSMVVVIPDDAVPGTTPGMEAPTSPPSSPEPAATVVPFVVTDSIDTTDKRLNVTVGGETVYIRNGGRIDVGDGVEVEIYIDPYPPTTLHSILDVYVTQDGKPAPDVSVDVEFDMLSMLHGPFFGTARDIGGGHHLTTLDYIMFGAWDQFVTIRLGLDRIRFPVVIVAYP